MLAKAVYEGICIGNLDYIRILLMIDNYTNLWMCYNYAYLFYILYFTYFFESEYLEHGKTNYYTFLHVVMVHCCIHGVVGRGGHPSTSQHEIKLSLRISSNVAAMFFQYI